MNALYLPFIMQGILMLIDERIHIKRGLGLWERLGHPLDTLTIFVPLAFISINEFSQEHLTVFIILGAFSCLFITKDEFVHTRDCGGIENWLHSLLFIIHPLIFFCAALLWRDHPEDHFISYQPLIVGGFMLYQIIRWSIPWKQAK